MSAIEQRIQEAADRVGGVPRLSEMTGIKKTTLYGWIKGPSEPRASDLLAIAQAASVSVSWLVEGRDGPAPYQLGFSESDQAPLTTEQPDMVTLPRFSVQASAGSGAVVLAEDVEEWFNVPWGWLSKYIPKGARFGLIEARGDSMEPTIADGDLLLLNFDFHRADIPLGGVYVITLSSMLMVKRLQVTPTGNVRVISDNDLYPADFIISRRGDFGD